jgi:hypothetical protein
MTTTKPSSPVTNSIELKERIKDMVITSPDFVFEKISFFSILQEKGLGNINVLDYVEKAVDKVMNTPEDVCLNAFREMAGMSHLSPYKFIRTMLAKEVIQIKYGLDAEDSIIDFFGWLAVYYRYMEKKKEERKERKIKMY